MPQRRYSFGFTSRTLLASVAIALAACRPDVELAIPCEERGNLSCPSGHHCGPHGACEPGEVAPSIELTRRLHHEELSGTVTVEATVASPLGLVGARVSLHSLGDGSVVELDSTLDEFDDLESIATLRFQLETWRVEDGPAGLVLTAWAAGDVPPGRMEIPIIIANGRATIRLAEELPEAPLSAPHDASVHVTSLVELRHVSVTFGGYELNPILLWRNGDRLDATVNVLLDPSELPEGETMLVVTAVDVASRESVLELPVQIAPSHPP